MKILLSFALLFAFNLPSCDSDKAKQEEQGRESISAAQDLKAKADIQNLQNGILAFQAHFDRNPASLDELAKSGLIQAIPQPNEGQKYVYDPASGRVTVEGTAAPPPMTTDQDTIKKYAVSMQSRAEMKKIESAINVFSSQEGRNPSSLNELVERGMLEKLPPEPMGFRYDYDPASGKLNLAPK